MTSRHLPFLSNTPEVSGTVTRFAIVHCKLDPTLKVAALKVALDWVLSERASGKALDAEATPWQARFYTRDKAGRTATVAVVEVSHADAVEERGAESRELRFHVEVEFEVPFDGALPPLEVTIRRVEDVSRSPAGDMIGYADAPDLDLHIASDISPVRMGPADPFTAAPADGAGPCSRETVGGT